MRRDHRDTGGARSGRGGGRLADREGGRLVKGFVQVGYGSSDVLRLKEVEKPVPGDGEVLVRVYATSINAGDYFTMKGKPFPVRLMLGLTKPRNGRIAGWDLAGCVEAVGGEMTGLAPGDEVYGAAGMNGGAFAEYACLPEGSLAAKPANLTFEQAAAVPVAAVTALRGLRDAGRLQPDQKVLINNASGGVGTFAVQIAKALGAEVTGVCSTKNVAMVRSIGADHVFDYTKEDFTKSGLHYDLILDNIGTHSFSDYKRALTPQGKVVPNTGHAGLGYVVKSYLLSTRDPQVGRMFSGTPRTEDLMFLKGLVESGQVAPVVDRTYPFGEIPAAMAYTAQGHVAGKVVITVEQRDL
ncbi:MAG: NAD(P)-dependent alcohol dehydrogenase [Thermoleophilia bacterium]|nr:NAD(P)-dependent alcohol dehydrogenase [Thermoleophilia bacterium]